jgi:RHS repeat-associated protein
LVYYSGTGAIVAIHDTSPLGYSGAGWKQFNLNSHAPRDAVRMEIRLTADADAGLSYSFDDIKLQVPGLQGQDKYDYTGKKEDEGTGLKYFGARFYDPETGRFLTQDPFMGSFRLVIPQSQNRYSYCWNNPLKYTDPTGRDNDDMTNDQWAAYCESREGYSGSWGGSGSDGSSSDNSINNLPGGNPGIPSRSPDNSITITVYDFQMNAISTITINSWVTNDKDAKEINKTNESFKNSSSGASFILGFGVPYTAGASIWGGVRGDLFGNPPELTAGAIVTVTTTVVQNSDCRASYEVDVISYSPQGIGFASWSSTHVSTGGMGWGLDAWRGNR